MDRSIAPGNGQWSDGPLTSYTDDEVLFDAIAAGAAGYVLNQIGGDDLVRALMTVSRGESMLDPAVTQKVFQHMRARPRMNIS